ncbi:MAG TPA: hypothetical protein VIL35_10790 [Vicinamibacterales bacterium]
MIVAATLAMAVLLAPVLYAFGERLLSGNGQLPPTLWRSSPPGVDLIAWLLPNPAHPLWRDTMIPLIQRWAGRGDAYPEFVAPQSCVALGVIALAWLGGWRPSRAWLAFTDSFGLLALGPFLHVAGVNTQILMPWSVLRYAPVLGMVRSPTRFSVLATLGVAMLFALAHLTRRHPQRRRLLLAAIVVAGACELVPLPRTLYSAGVPALYDTIASDPRHDIRVLEVPAGIRDGASSLGDVNPRTQYFRTAHGKPIVGGVPAARRTVAQGELPAAAGAERLDDAERGQGAHAQSGGGGPRWRGGVHPRTAHRVRRHRSQPRHAGAGRLRQ